MGARLDPSSFSIVVWCPECSGFAAVTTEMGDALDVACRHNSGVHPGVFDMHLRRSKWRKKNAQKGVLTHG